MTTGGTVVLVGHFSARRGRVKRAAEAAAAVFQANGHPTVLLSTDSPDHGSSDPNGWGASLRRHLAAHHAPAPAAVVAVGGDGTAHVVLNVLLQHRERHHQSIPFGLIASGSGNDLARHWDSPQDDPERSAGRVLRRLDNGPILMDVGQVDFEDGSTAWFATALCAGIDAAVNQRANRYRWPRGSAKYIVALAVELLRHRAQDYSLEITEPGSPGPTHRGLQALMVNVANSSSIGGGLGIVPWADATDAALELFVVAPLTRLRFLRLFPSIYTGAHVRLKAVAIQPVTRVRIRGRHVVFADGEPLGQLPATVTVRPAALPVVL
ncbi:diacylglycerol/lipid kinase family protein [Kocuria sp.]|uniref:diacylglycerol/lipid kinase family protein n=1 Tax=Kocuria sp. TaxID=1871328 RepID=UPI0026E07DA9|nr:diacylglycerol kinase family protein [Kocuria sp.]MDO5619703.1 diacylglycerol kinase family protein [Kocuria sp.]